MSEGVLAGTADAERLATALEAVCSSAACPCTGRRAAVALYAIAHERDALAAEVAGLRARENEWLGAVLKHYPQNYAFDPTAGPGLLVQNVAEGEWRARNAQVTEIEGLKARLACHECHGTNRVQVDLASSIACGACGGTLDQIGVLEETLSEAVFCGGGETEPGLPHLERCGDCLTCLREDLKAAETELESNRATWSAHSEDLAAAAQRAAALAKAARAFADKVMLCEQSAAMKDVYATALAHGAGYRGESWADEYDTLDALLAGIFAAAPEVTEKPSVVDDLVDRINHPIPRDC